MLKVHVQLKMHFAFDLKSGPAEEVIEFESMEELKNLLKNFPTLSIKGNTIYKQQEGGFLPVGHLLEDSSCELG